MQLVAYVKRLEQEEWLQRTQTHECERFFRAVLRCDAGEQRHRLRMVMEEYYKRVAVCGALHMRTTYTLLAEGILSIERREKTCRKRITGYFRARCGLYKTQYLENRCRCNLEETEHAERVRSRTLPALSARLRYGRTYATHMLRTSLQSLTTPAPCVS